MIDHVYDTELRIERRNFEVTATDVMGMSLREQVGIIECFFEYVETPLFCLQNGCILSLYASGRTTGINVDSGAGGTRICPIYEGYPFHSHFTRFPDLFSSSTEEEDVGHPFNGSFIGGDTITDRLHAFFLSQKADIMTFSNDVLTQREIVQDIKEQCCYICGCSLGNENEKEEQVLECVYTLPDGRNITLGRERYQIPEQILFHKNQNLCELIFETIQRCDIDIRKDFYQNIVLSGGNTMFEGLVERLSNDIQCLGPNHARIKVNAPSERRFSAWIGGSIASSLNSWKRKIFATRKEFQEYGAQNIAKRKFPFSIISVENNGKKKGVFYNSVQEKTQNKTDQNERISFLLQQQQQEKKLFLYHQNSKK